MTSQSSICVERLWSSGDGAFCLLVERADAPRYEICLIRGEDVVREHRLYARAAAEMVADTWRTATLNSERSSVHSQFPPLNLYL